MGLLHGLRLHGSSVKLLQELLLFILFIFIDFALTICTVPTIEHNIIVTRIIHIILLLILFLFLPVMEHNVPTASVNPNG